MQADRRSTAVSPDSIETAPHIIAQALSTALPIRYLASIRHTYGGSYR